MSKSTLEKTLKKIDKKCDVLLSRPCKCGKTPVGGFKRQAAQAARQAVEKAKDFVREKVSDKDIADFIADKLPLEYGVKELRKLVGFGKIPARQAVKGKATTNVVKSAEARTARKPSKYQSFMKKELRRLKKAHPEVHQTDLMKTAAASWSDHHRGGLIISG